MKELKTTQISVRLTDSERKKIKECASDSMMDESEYAAFCFPMTVLIMTGFIKGIPTELEEAMVIDGANIFEVFFQMVLPLSVPGLVSASIFNFIQVWNNLLFPLIFISDQKKGTISMGLLAFFGEYSTDYSASMAGICLTTIPVIIAYIFFQDKIENGLMAGAVKG